MLRLDRRRDLDRTRLVPLHARARRIEYLRERVGARRTLRPLDPTTHRVTGRGFIRRTMGSGAPARTAMAIARDS